MIRNRLAKLEKALEGTIGPACAWCGGAKGIGNAPLIILDDDPTNLTPYDESGRCPRCGAVAPEPVHVPACGLMTVLSSVVDPFRRKLLVAMALDPAERI